MPVRFLATAALVAAACFAPATAHGAPPPDDGYPDQPAGVAFPTAEWPTGDLAPTVDRAAIDAAVDAGFGPADADGRVQSIVVVQGGRIVYERYHPLDGPETVYNSFSVAKSFTSALAGLLVAEGRLALDEPAPVAAWQTPGDARQAITLRQLLQMSSGLTWEEVYDAESLGGQMIGAENAAALVAAQALESPPGTVFEYSTGTTALLAGNAADELGGCQAALDYLNGRLLDPIGITTDVLQTDGRGCWFGGFGANMTTRDFARFGLLYLRGGQWDGQQIVPTSWIDESRVPAASNASYGLQFWLSEDGTSFSAEGLFGQRIIIVPGDDLVIVTNSTAGGDPYTMVERIRAALDPHLVATR